MFLSLLVCFGSSTSYPSFSTYTAPVLSVQSVCHVSSRPPGDPTLHSSWSVCSLYQHYPPPTTCSWLTRVPSTSTVPVQYLGQHSYHLHPCLIWDIYYTFIHITTSVTYYFIRSPENFRWPIAIYCCPSSSVVHRASSVVRRA